MRLKELLDPRPRELDRLGVMDGAALAVRLSECLLAGDGLLRLVHKRVTHLRGAHSVSRLHRWPQSLAPLSGQGAALGAQRRTVG